MTMDVEITLTGEHARQFEYLLENAETTDGSEVDAEDLATHLLEQAVVEQYMQTFR